MEKGTKTIEGIISTTIKGTGYLRAEGYEEDIQIDFKDLGTALNGDKVEIKLSSKKEGKLSGEVVKILSRAKTKFSGILNKEKNGVLLRPDDIKMYADILIPQRFLNGARVGEKVYVEITSWKTKNKNPEGKVLKILGKPGENNTEMRAIAMEKGFDSDFPKLVEKEAEKIKSSGIKKEDLKNRRDFRNISTFTIDPEDAKDFDDAISFRKLGTGDEYEIGIHIADVSHYVKIGSELDREAKRRGTSVYLVDRTIPMLPEALSNELCSLLPNKDRLAMSAVFVVDQNMHVKREWFGQTVINSNKRFTYEEAERSIKEKEAPFHKELSTLNTLAKKLTKKRFEEGAISLEQEEVKFILDKRGIPQKVIKKERGDSNKLIEEFMLLANKKVAELISFKQKTEGSKKGGGVFVYRVHQNPSKEKMEDLAFFLKGLGYNLPIIDGIIPSKEINKLLEKLAGKNEKNTVHRAVVRSMAKAAYSTQNVGHYGLAFKYYAHFTSPIRRYPDIVVHRILLEFLKGKKIGKDKLDLYEEISKKSSEREKYAADAERTSIKYKQTEYMSERIGKTFEGVISGITEWGMYVEELETKCEGLVRLRDLNDFYIFNEKKLELSGEKTKKRYRLGDIVKVKVKGTDLERKTIDYVLV